MAAQKTNKRFVVDENGAYWLSRGFAGQLIGLTPQGIAKYLRQHLFPPAMFNEAGLLSETLVAKLYTVFDTERTRAAKVVIQRDGIHEHLRRTIALELPRTGPTGIASIVAGFNQRMSLETRLIATLRPTHPY